MTPAIAIAGISAATTIIGTGLSYMGQMQQARSQAAMAEYAAQAERQRAEQLRRLGQVEYTKRQMEGKKLLGRQLALYGAAGVEPTEGSPMVVMEETAAEIERDALMARYKYQVGAASAETSAALQEYKAKTYKAAMPWQGAGTDAQNTEI
jgi:hypothetical protein